MGIFQSAIVDLFSAATDPSGVGTVAQWLPAGFGGRKTKSGQIVSQGRALTVGAYYGCIRNISEDIAKLPIWIRRETRTNGRRRNILLRDHNVWRLLNGRPNPDMNAISFRETLMAWALGWGDGFAEIVRNQRGQPVELWPIHPSRVRVERNTDGRIVYIVRSSIFTLDGRPIDADVTISEEDMFHLRGPGTGLFGWSILRFAAEALGIAISAQEFGATFFGNGTTISGVLVTPKSMDDESAEKLRCSWVSRYGGSGNAWKPAILENGLEWKPIGIPPKQAQFLEARRFQVIEICRWFRMPPHKVQSLERSTFSNIESQNIEYVVDTLTPWMSRWEQEIKVKLLLGQPRVFARHNANALLRGDMAGRANFYRTLLNIGALTPNEIREFEDLDPANDPDADSLWMPMNMQPIAAARDVPGQPDTPATTGAQADELQREAQAQALHPIAFDAFATIDKRLHDVRHSARKASTAESFAVKLDAKRGSFASFIRSRLLPMVQGVAPAKAAALDEYCRNAADRLLALSCATWPKPPTIDVETESQTFITWLQDTDA